jgi:hypothetical protein
MKKLTKAVLAILVVASSITACKKGEDDPGLSLSSRKARFAGEWKIDSFESSMTDVTTSNGSSTTTTRTDVNSTKIDGANYTYTSTVTSTAAGFTTYTRTATGTVSEYTTTIEKDGTWKSKQIAKLTSVTVIQLGVPTTESTNITITTESEGTWQFLGKNKDAELKNKEAVSLSTAKTTTTTVEVATDGTNFQSTEVEIENYGLNESVEVWTLSKLAKKEMVALAEIDNKYEKNTTSTSGNSKNGPDSSKGTVTITFSQD